MKLEQVKQATQGVPYMTEAQKDELYWFVMEQKPERILELGFCHGVSSCVMAAALQELGRGHIDTVDLLKCQPWQDQIMSIERLAERCGVSSLISVHRETTCYTWWLKKRLQEKEARPGAWRGYDFVYLDGAHTWNIDAAAFFMAEKLMRNGAWILFDDLKYNYQYYFDSTGSADRYGVPRAEMAPDEIAEPHVGLIFELLVRSHPNIDRFGYTKEKTWGWAQKSHGACEHAAREGLPQPGWRSRLSALRSHLTGAG